MTSIWYYWNSRTSIQKALHYLLLAVVLVMLMVSLVSSPANADAPYGYKDEVRADALSRRPNVRDFLTAEDRRTLKRIHARASARMEGRTVRRARTVAAYRDEPIPVRYERRPVESFNVRSKACRPLIERAGTERNLRWRAEESSMKAWRREAIDQHGYQFAGYTNAIGLHTTCSNIKGYVYICRTSGRPCKEL